jgi:hypothetical protein
VTGRAAGATLDEAEPRGTDIVDESNRKQISAERNGNPTIWI